MGTYQTELNEFKINWIKSCPDEALKKIYKERIEDGEIDPTTDYMGQELKLRKRNNKLKKIINNYGNKRSK